MPKILKTNINKLYVKKLEVNINEGNVQNVVLSENILKKDAEFYRNFLGVLVSFDYGTRLPDYDEAYSYTKQQIATDNPSKILNASCLFVREDDVFFERTVSRKEFKQLKKKYKERSK